MTLRASVAAAALSSGIAACGGSADPPRPPVCELPNAAKPGRQPGALTQCGPRSEFTPVNRYDDELAGAEDREDAVVLINGTCTGTLVAAAAGPIVLTAGHCVGLGDRALLAFNVEAEPDGDELVTNGTVIEQSTEPDYALIELDQLPAVTPTGLAGGSAADRVAIIQHPRGAPKVIAEGDLLGECADLISYADLDTLVGSSGAGVLDPQGKLLGVHTDGDCAEDGSGANLGWTSARIVAASAYLADTDLEAAAP